MAAELFAAELFNANASSRVLLVCEHASNYFPEEFSGLGLSKEDQQSHVAWDPGALAVAEVLADRLDARLVYSTISRLIYDCNRPPQSPTAMRARSEDTDIPGNANLSEAQKARRVTDYYQPFTDLLSDTVASIGADAIIVTIHSFTPVYHGEARKVEIGILHDTDSRLADQMLKISASQTTMQVMRNEPYGPADDVTHTLKLHGLENGLLNVMIEIRNDLIESPDQQRAVGEMMARWIELSLSNLEEKSQKDVA